MTMPWDEAFPPPRPRFFDKTFWEKVFAPFAEESDEPILILPHVPADMVGDADTCNYASAVVASRSDEANNADNGRRGVDGES
jgi:hypothetical protein